MVIKFIIPNEKRNKAKMEMGSSNADFVMNYLIPGCMSRTSTSEAGSEVTVRVCPERRIGSSNATALFISEISTAV